MSVHAILSMLACLLLGRIEVLILHGGYESDHPRMLEKGVHIRGAEQKIWKDHHVNIEYDKPIHGKG